MLNNTISILCQGASRAQWQCVTDVHGILALTGGSRGETEEGRGKKKHLVCVNPMKGIEVTSNCFKDVSSVYLAIDIGQCHGES